MKTFVKVSNRSEVKTSANVLNKDGKPAQYVTLTLQKDNVRVEKHEIPGMPDRIVLNLPTSVTENQWLEPCTIAQGQKAGTVLKRGLIADAQVGMSVPGDILPLGPADGTTPESGVDPYYALKLDENGKYVVDDTRTYTTTNTLFIGEFDQESDEFQARVQKAIDRFNAQMVAAGRTAVVFA